MILSRLIAPAAAALGALAFAGLAAAQGSGGVTGPAIYVDGELYRTVGTPSDFSDTGAPGHSYDVIYAFPDPDMTGASLQASVAELAPGDTGYNGGRWQVQVLAFTDYDAAVAAYDTNGSGDLDSAAEVEAAIDAGAATTSAGPSFECPIIPMPASGK